MFDRETRQMERKKNQEILKEIINDRDEVIERKID
jgi:hypothetical protein